MRDWTTLEPIITMVNDAMAEHEITYQIAGALTIDRAEHLLVTFGVNVFNDDTLFDYFAGYVAAVSVLHTLLHMPEETGLPPTTEGACNALVTWTLQNLIPLMPLLPQQTWVDQ